MKLKEILRIKPLWITGDFSFSWITGDYASSGCRPPKTLFIKHVHNFWNNHKVSVWNLFQLKNIVCFAWDVWIKEKSPSVTRYGCSALSFRSRHCLVCIFSWTRQLHFAVIVVGCPGRNWIRSRKKKERVIWEIMTSTQPWRQLAFKLKLVGISRLGLYPFQDRMP